MILQDKCKKINILFIVCFLLLIVIPVILSDKVGGKISEVENRYLAKFPSVADENNNFSLTGFRSNFENYVNDNIGFRDEAQKVNTIIYWNIFNLSSKSDTMIGKDNWLFYYTPEIIKDFQKRNIPSSNDLCRYYENFDELRKFCESRNSEFFFFYLPDKKTIYPEQYNKHILKQNGMSRSDKIIDYFKESNINFIAPFNELFEAKKDAVVYSPRLDNAHWNSYGSFVGYKALIQKICDVCPYINSFEKFSYNISPNIQYGLFNGVIPISEESYYIEEINNSKSVIADQSWYNSLSKYNSITKIRYINVDQSLPKALVIGDSYCECGLINCLSNHFSQVTFIHNLLDIGILHEAMDSLQPDIVIYEIVERMFDAGESSLNYLKATNFYEN